MPPVCNFYQKRASRILTRNWFQLGPASNWLQGKRALITAGTSGIGIETGRREGAKVAITGLSKTGLDAARKELGDAIVIESDAGNAAEQGKVVEEVRQSPHCLSN